MSRRFAPLKPRSDLGLRTLSGVAMMSVAIAAIWFGGYAFMALIVLVGVGVYREFARLVRGFAKSPASRAVWLIGGVIYIGLACFTLVKLSEPFFGLTASVLLIAGVIGTDVGAYFAGRTFGGPKIAPRISPSKTWSGLLGGMIGAGLTMVAAHTAIIWGRSAGGGSSNFAFAYDWKALVVIGVAVAAVAQTGDFFESWMKRRAGVKDSGRMIPGHGGLFDRTDGLIAVAFFAGVVLVVHLAIVSFG